MYQVLFVCTANIFRSRFSEEVYNHISEKLKLSTKAFSAGLKVGSYTTRKIYIPALNQLELLNISPKRKDDLSVHINDLDLNNFNKIICMDRNEHLPMVSENKYLKNFNIEYWNIIDEPKVSSHISLPKCFEKVKELVKTVALEINS
tara:strand:+ start:611 stop:1051 length:441 start_codon:yes stop_codon:yes gene_type:complete